MTDTTRSADGLDWGRAAHGLGLLVLAFVLLLFVAGAVPEIVGADHSYVVLSDSMSPAIDAGAVVFVSEVPTETIERDDVITYEQRTGVGDRRVTHRVMEVVERDGERRFRTRGDANEDPDPRLVSPSQVVGVVTFHVPYLGHVTSFAQSKLGLVVLVIVPSILLALSEVRTFLTAAETSAEDDSSNPGGENEP